MNTLPGNTLTVRVIAEGEKVPLGSFLRVLNETLSMLRDIDLEMSSRGQWTLRWQIIHVTYNSPLMMTITGEPARVEDFSTGVVTEYLEGLGRLERGIEPSPLFPDTAMKKAKRLTIVRNDGIDSVIFSAPDRQPVEPTQHLAANVDVILKRRLRVESTTLDGTLEAINTHGRYTFQIYDAVTGRGIRCYFTDELLGEAAQSLRQRVAVTGLAKYNRAGRPTSMKVESMRRLRRPSDLPMFREGEGIQITGGVSSEEYVRRARDAE